MGLLDRISRVVRANINDLVNKAEDPEKILEQSLIDMNEDLVQLRQAVASSIASQKRTEQQYNQNVSQANQWLSRAQLALQKGDENLAKEALKRKKSYEETANSLKSSLDSQTVQVDAMKRNLTALEGKISEAKTKKDMLKARMTAAKAQEQLNNTIGSLNTSAATATFERMEEKVLQMEARSTAAAELASGGGLEDEFKKLEAGSSVDDDLALLKAQLAGGSQPVGSLPQGQANTSNQAQKDVDLELEQLRSELDKM
jgi:phage shock protein A